jgi:hypothetical protein
MLTIKDKTQNITNLIPNFWYDLGEGIGICVSMHMEQKALFHIKKGNEILGFILIGKKVGNSMKIVAYNEYSIELFSCKNIPTFEQMLEAAKDLFNELERVNKQIAGYEEITESIPELAEVDPELRGKLYAQLKSYLESIVTPEAVDA